MCVFIFDIKKVPNFVLLISSYVLNLNVGLAKLQIQLEPLILAVKRLENECQQNLMKQGYMNHFEQLLDYTATMY